MQELVNYLLHLGTLDKQQVDTIASTAIYRHLKVGDYFSEAGKMVNETAFVLKGILRIGNMPDSGQQTTLYFIAENDFVIDMEDSPYQAPLSAYVQAVIKSELAVLTAAGLQTLSSAIPAWDTIFKQIIARTLLDKAARITPAIPEDATTRYKDFLEHHSSIASRVPLGHLASYLGITQQSLSRIRKQLTRRQPPYYGR